MNSADVFVNQKCGYQFDLKSRMIQLEDVHPPKTGVRNDESALL